MTMIRSAFFCAAAVAITGCSSTSEALAPAQTVQVATPAAASQLNANRSFGTSSQIPAVVNGEAITKLMVSRRAAFLKLRRAKNASRTAARDELIEDALKLQEGKRRGVRVPPQRIDEAYAGFAKNNKLSVSQLNQILSRAGVTPAGFKDYIRAQITWSSLVAQRGQGAAAKPLTEREAVARMLQAGGEKPTATEYLLQQVIFVVPAAKRSNGTLEARRREANAMRSRFTSCEQTVGFAKGLKDVTVRDLGRKVGPELPPDWKPLIEKTAAGRATSVRITPRGAEFIGVCRAREVSDDRTAQLVFSTRDAKSEGGDAGVKYLAELRKNAKIETR